MNITKLLTPLVTASIAVIAMLMLSSCGSKSGKKRTAEDILSANIALLDGDEVPDYDLITNDSLLRFETAIADLGRMKVGQKKDVVFKFTNVSPSPVVITRIVSACGCTSVEYEKQPIRAGKSSKIMVSFEAEESGVFFKKLFIYHSGRNAPLEIAIKGEVR